MNSYQITLEKITRLSVMIEAQTEAEAIEKGRREILEDDETAYIEESRYTEPEAYLLERN